MKNLICLFTVFLTLNNSHSQSRIVDLFEKNKNDVRYALEITYFGVDFSAFELLNAKKVGTESEVKKYIPAWLNKFNTAVTTDSLSTCFGFPVYSDLDKTQKRFKLLKDDWISFSQNELDISETEAILSSYQLNQSDGVGMVIMAENFIKPKEEAILSYVFFSIKTRKCLLRIRTAGKTFGAGMTNRWANAMGESYEVFKAQYLLSMSNQE